MTKKFLFLGFVFFLFSGLAFGERKDSAEIKKPTEVTKIFYYFILDKGVFMSQGDSNTDGQFCLMNCQIIETEFPTVRQSVFLETGKKDSSGNLIYEMGVFGFKSKEEAYAVLRSIGCCEK